MANPPTHDELMAMPKADLANTTIRSVSRAEKAKAAAIRAAKEIMDYVFSAIGAAVIGWWLGSIAREIEAGTEGYDEESMSWFGVDKDLVVGVAGAVTAQMGWAKKYKDTVRQVSAGIIAFWSGRTTFGMALEREDEEEAAA